MAKHDYGAGEMLVFSAADFEDFAAADFFFECLFDAAESGGGGVGVDFDEAHVDSSAGQAMGDACAHRSAADHCGEFHFAGLCMNLFVESTLHALLEEEQAHQIFAGGRVHQLAEALALSGQAGIVATIAYWGYRDATSGVVISLLVGVVYAMGSLIQLDLAARVCRLETAGTTFALLMSLSTVIVALNAQLLRRERSEPVD